MFEDDDDVMSHGEYEESYGLLDEIEEDDEDDELEPDDDEFEDDDIEDDIEDDEKNYD